MEDEADQRLKMAKMFFEFGGDPNLWYEGESLYDHVLWEVFNDSYSVHEWEYSKRFFILLLAYGGGERRSDYPKPSLREPIDKERIDMYDLKLITCEDGYHLEGHIFNPDGIDIGTV